MGDRLVKEVAGDNLLNSTNSGDNPADIAVGVILVFSTPFLCNKLDLSGLLFVFSGLGNKERVDVGL